MDYVDEYVHIFHDYNLSRSQKLQFMHNIVRGDAKRFYLNVLYGFTNTFEQAVEITEKEYNSAVSQARVKNFLNGFHITSFVS